jgi:2-methylcitrate dehydratase PrpD
MGVAIGASRHSSVEAFISMKDELQSAEQVAIIGRPERADLLWATLINGTSSHVFDFDDTHLETLNHPTSVIAPVCFALGEYLNLSGQTILHAFILGIEADLRIGNSVSPSHYDAGWHITSTAGVFGAAIAAGILLDLGEDELIYALGIAGTQASGLLEMLGTMTKLFHPGKAGQNGLWASMLAARGIESSRRILESELGFASLYASESDLGRVNSDWGSTWELSKLAFKPYACGIVLHPIIDAFIELGGKVSGSDIDSVVITVNPYVTVLTDKANPTNGLEARYSVRHVAAIAFYDGDASVEQFSDARVFAPEITALIDRVSIVVDESMKEDQTAVRLVTTSGEVIGARVEHAVGSVDNPMSDEALIAKFRKLSSVFLGSGAVDALVDDLLHFDALATIHQLVANTINN